MLTVENLSVAIDGRKLVDGISFEIADGGSLGLVGPSGSGKSTILRAVAGLILFSGRIDFNGLPLAAYPRTERARLLGMVFQDPYGALHPRHTVARALAEPLIIAGEKGQRERTAAALDEVGLGQELRDRFPHQLSGGQRQRVVIARALMLKPKLLLLDEPTSALDMTVQAEILDLLEAVRARHGLSYLMVAHSPPILTRLCERCLAVENGRIHPISNE